MIKYSYAIDTCSAKDKMLYKHNRIFFSIRTLFYKLYEAKHVPFQKLG